MSTRFFTNEGDNTLLAKFAGVFQHNPDLARFDALVGYLRASALHGQRRARVERFLREVGLSPAETTSLNPLEQPWSLPPTEFAKRTKNLPPRLHESARAETAALTERIVTLEAEINAHAYRLYGLTEAEIALVEGPPAAVGPHSPRNSCAITKAGTCVSRMSGSPTSMSTRK